VIADWEIDGPIEWNDAWSLAKRCTRCRRNIPDIDDFEAFQTAYRKIRCAMQKEAYAEVVKQYYPEALVGNYAEYPNDGRRYWYDYFEHPPTNQPHIQDQREPVRPWYNGFAETGYTVAVPVVYTWHRTFAWYDYADPDYRWFYNLLKVGSNAAGAAGASLPILTFVHWHTTAPPAKSDPTVPQMSATAYTELLWHLLLRGHDGFAMWCPAAETIEETRLVHEVYAESMRFTDFLTRGTPVTFAVPKRQGPVVSALRLGKKLLVRRTDFAGSDDGPASLEVDGGALTIPRTPGKRRILDIPQRRCDGKNKA
jgi:hypothetical protein